ncbi:MAG: exodeoxyribonuclease VII large subunit [Tannerella sp.]|jgi:exodeoxyribonuclease VII large subunit|nr:exodeoxyribonuclease VII large subunit [Tannerella sp.]
MDLFNDISEKDNPLSLSDLNSRVEMAIHASFPETCWVRAETSDVRVNASSGHCYLEFIEKDELTGQFTAKARGSIWARTFKRLQPYFEDITGQEFKSGLKVLVNVTVEFHRVYGYSLTINDIEPSYTLGDIIKKRLETINRLKADGVYDMNRELPFPDLPQRIAVITSPTAAGYEDFVNQLINNAFSYQFYIKLFPAVMQGDKTEESVIEALGNVSRYTEMFDVVVIIRGGGSASELNCFDSYPLASHCAQFPLPIITGIGHERDDTIVDMVANTRMKTPTAVAAFLIEKMHEQAGELVDIQEYICERTAGLLTVYDTQLRLLAARFPSMVTQLLERRKTQLITLSNQLSAAHLLIAKQDKELELTAQFLKMASPEYILQRGYSLTVRNGQIIKRAAELSAGDEIAIRYSDGERAAVIK